MSSVLFSIFSSNGSNGFGAFLLQVLTAVTWSNRAARGAGSSRRRLISNSHRPVLRAHRKARRIRLSLHSDATHAGQFINRSSQQTYHQMAARAFIQASEHHDSLQNQIVHVILEGLRVTPRRSHLNHSDASPPLSSLIPTSNTSFIPRALISTFPVTQACGASPTPFSRPLRPEP